MDWNHLKDGYLTTRIIKTAGWSYKHCFNIGIWKSVL